MILNPSEITSENTVIMKKRKILTFAASNSRSSINQKLALHACNVLCEIFQDTFEVALIDLNDFEMPLYSVERQDQNGVPELAHKFLNHIRTADGLVISFAEHNGSYSVAYKNIFDWCSRIEVKVYQDKPMLTLATSPGSRGGDTVLETANAALPYFGGRVVASMKVPSFTKNYDEVASKIRPAQISKNLKTATHAFGAAILLE